MPIEVRDVLNPGEKRVLSDTVVSQIIRRTEVLGSGLSGRLGIKVKPGTGWAADPVSKTLIYDLGTAAILNDRARTGVIAHEAGHLRFTKHYDTDRLPEEIRSNDRALGRFHDLANCFEDKRMELLMEDEFPGLAADFAELAKTFDVPALQRGVLMAAPALQFVIGVHRAIYGREPITQYQEVRDHIDRLRPDMARIVRLRTTQEMADALLEPGGFYDTMRSLLDNPPEAPQGAPGDDGETGEGEGEGQQGEGKGQGEGSGFNSSLYDGDDESQTGGKPGESDEGESDEGESDEGESDESDEGASDEGESESDESEGAIDGKGQTHVDGGTGTGHQKVADAEFAELDELGDSLSPRDEEQLAALTEHQRELLNALIEDMERQPEVRGVAEAVKERLDALAAEQLSIGRAIEERIARGRHVADDERNPTPDAPGTYDSVVRGLGGKPSVLARALASVLRENSFDRWSVAGYKTGAKLHNRKLTRSAMGNLSVYRRKERPKNRKYAVSIVGDISGSMYGHRLRMLREGMLLVGEALEKAHIELAMYAFGDDVVCIKPFDQPLSTRKGKLGSFIQLTHSIGSHTCMGWALKRASEDLLSRYGNDDWQKMVVVLTDGMPNACGKDGGEHRVFADPTLFVRELEARGVECIGIGIAEDGVTTIFPHAHLVIEDVNELPRLLVQVIRQRVRKG